MDNLNTHKPAALYQAFKPAQARALLERLEIHHTPKHGSWLNQGFEGGPNSHVVGMSPRTMKVDTFMATSDRLNAFLSEAP